MLLAGLCGFFAAAPARAAVSIDATLGFSGHFRIGRFAPLELTLTNDGVDVRAIVEVQHDSGSEFDGTRLVSHHRQRVDLPRGARKRLHLTLAIGGIAKPLRITVHRRDATDTAPLAEQVIDLRRGFVNERLLAVVSRNADLDALNARGDQGLRVVYPHPDRLPQRWQGYGALAGVVLHDATLENLSNRQFQALRRWISSGGVLVVSGGPHYSALRTGRFADLLPGLPDGIHVLPDTADLATAFAAVPHGQRRFSVHRVGRFRGRAVYAAGEIPLVIREDVGRGAIVYLTFDIARYPFIGWDGMAALMDEMLQWGRSPAPLDAPVSDMARGALAKLVRSGDVGFPAAGTVLVFALLYLGLLATVLYMQPRGTAHASPLRGHALAFVVAGVFSGLAYLLFGPFAHPRGATLVSLSSIEPLPDSQHAVLRLTLGMYGEQSGPLRLAYTGAEPLLLPERTTQASSEQRRWRFDHGATALAVQPGRHSAFVLHRLAGEDIIEFPLDAQLHRDDKGFTLRIANGAGVDLDQAWLAHAGRLHRLATIASSISTPSVQRIAHDAGLTWAQWRQETLAAGAIDTTKIGLLQQIVKEQPNDSPSSLLFALVRAPLQVADSPARVWRQHDLAVVMLRLGAVGEAHASAPIQLAPEQASHVAVALP